MLPLHHHAAEVRATLEHAAAPAADALRRRAGLRAFVPRLVLRFTYRTLTTGIDPLIDEPGGDGWRWPSALGATFELRAVWGLGATAEPLSPLPSLRAGAALRELP